jgi:hypothetical protein
MFNCKTKENVRIDASKFIDTAYPTHETYQFFKRRALAVRLPCNANEVTWQLKNARKPKHALVQKSGRYWNVIDEQF